VDDRIRNNLKEILEEKRNYLNKRYNDIRIDFNWDMDTHEEIVEIIHLGNDIRTFSEIPKNMKGSFKEYAEFNNLLNELINKFKKEFGIYGKDNCLCDISSTAIVDSMEEKN